MIINSIPIYYIILIISLYNMNPEWKHTNKDIKEYNIIINSILNHVFIYKLVYIKYNPM